jgi:PKD repeat protein
MKKLLTLALGILMSSAFLNAQNCDFTFTSDSTSGTYTFTAPAAFNPMLFTFIWNYNNGSGFGSGAVLTATYNQPTTDAVSLSIYTIDSNLVCASTQTITIWGGGGSGSQCPISYNQATPADPYTFIFSVPGANYSPTWTFENGTTSSGFQVSNTFLGPGLYNVCMNITGGGFTCDDCISIYIAGDSTNTPGCSADFWASTSALVGYYIPTGNNYSNTASYAWTFGDGSSSSDLYPYHEYTASGTYDVCLTVTNGSCSDSMCQYVFIPENNTIPADSSCYAGFVVSQDSPYTVTIVNTTSGNNLNFNWTLSTGFFSITASGAFPSLVVDSTGSFVLCLSVDNGNGCSATFCDSVIVDANGTIGGRLNSTGFTINVVSPQVATGYVLGVEATSAASFTVYPNPFSDVVTINGAADFSSYQIFAVDGKKIQQGAVSGTIQTLNTSNLSQGVYVLTLTDSKGNTQVQKIVKK